MFLVLLFQKFCTSVILIELVQDTNTKIVDINSLQIIINKEIHESWKLLTNIDTEDDNGNEEVNGVVIQMTNLLRYLQILEQGISNIDAVASSLAAEPKSKRLELWLYELVGLVHQVNTASSMLLEYTRSDKEIEEVTLEDFARSCVSHNPAALPGILERLQRLIISPYAHRLNQNFYELILQNLKV